MAAVFGAMLLTVPMGAVGEPGDPLLEVRQATLDLYGGGATAVVAQKLLGLDEFMGKAFDAPHAGPSKAGIAGASAGRRSSSGPITEHRPARSANNVAIHDFSNVSENEPTVVVNPRNRNRLVAGTHFIGDTANRCVAHYSRDGGRSWNLIPIFMPQLTHDSECSDPVLAYAPDGSRVYYAYMDIKATNFEIVLSYSDDDGRSWTGPIVALSNATADYDKLWIATHTALGDDDDDDRGRQRNNSWVYVTATRFDFAAPFRCHIDFARSADKGSTWSAAQTLDASTAGCGSAGSELVQGSRPTGGLGNDVIVAWYNSRADGNRNASPFEIRIRYSSDNGATFGPTVVAALDSFELNQFLGPFSFYHRWWGGMFPDVEIAADGSAHIAYVHDPVSGNATDEEGNIRYVGSAGRPYSTWSAPATVNDDASGKAQGWATLEAGVDGRRVVLYALWEDHRASETDNLFWDVFTARKVGSGAWSNRKLADERSTSDFLFLGDYFDISLTAGGDPFVYGVWTDRRDEPSEFSLDDDIWGARIDD